MAKRSTSIPISPDALEPADNDGKSSSGKQHRSGSKSRPRRILRPNWRFTLIVLVTLAVAGGTMHVVHEVQIHSMADELLVRSRELSSESRTAEAVQYLRRYLVLRPNETSSLAMLAELLQESATGSRQRLEAYLLNERVLQATPADQSVLRRQVDLALALDRSRDAVTHLEKLKEARPEDGELDFLYGRAFEADGRFAEAAVHYRTAIAQQYRKPLVYLQLASLLEQLGQPEAADGALAEMVTANADSAEAFLARATYRVRKGQFAMALEDLRQAEQLAPQDREVILLRARLSLVGAGGSEDTVDTSTVREQLRGAINREPDVAELYLTAAQVELGEGQLDAAAKVLAEGCDRLPEDAQLELVRTDLLMTRDRLEDADKRIERLRQMRVSRPYLDYLEARRLVQQGEFVDAVPRLQAVAAAAAGRLELRHLALVQLGHCCRKIGDYSGQLAASEQILAADPLSREARTTAAEALAKLGRIDEALEHYGHMAGKGNVSQEIARLLIARNLRMAPAERDWGAVTRVLEHAATEAEDPVPVYDLQATVLILQGQIDTAQELLEQVRADDPTDARRWAAIVRLALRRGDAAKAETLLEEAATHTGDDVQLRLVRAELLARSADGADDTKFTSLMEETSGFSSEEQLQLLDGLSVIQFRRGHFDAAVRMWEQIVRQQPWRVDVLLRLFQSSLQNGDLQHSNELLEKMRQAEGGDGLHVRTAEALLLVRQAEEGDASGVATARQRLSQLAADYPHWSALSLAQARIEETAGNTQGAADHYLQAVSQGSRDPRVIRRVLELLLTLERQDDRIRLMEIIQQDATTVVQNSVQRLSAELALRSGRQEEAVRLARESMADRETGSADYIWFGHILDAAGKSDDALKAFDKAISLSSNRLLPWQAYIGVLVRSDQPGAAREALTRAKEALPEKEARLLAAQSGTLLGEMEAAAENYQAALKLSPEDPEILRQAAGFYLQGGKDPGEAERLLRKYIALDPAPSAARLRAGRRLLAELLSRQAYPQFLEAIGLIDENMRQFGSNPADLRTRGVLLLQRPYPEHVNQAIGMLEQVRDAGVLSVEDRQLLAASYEKTGEAKRADEEWNSLMMEGEQSAAAIRQYVQYLLRGDRFDDAEQWLNRLRELEPDELATVSLAVHLAVRQGDSQTAVEQLTTFIGQGEKQQQADRTSFAASLLAGLAVKQSQTGNSAVELFEQATGFYRMLDQSKAGVRFGLARVAAFQGNLSTALDECEAGAAAGAAWPAVISTGIGVLRASSPAQPEIARVEAWLSNVPQEKHNLLPVLLMRADLKMIQHQYAAAAELYTTILGELPSSVVALNNLAWIRAVSEKKFAEAGALIEKAIEVTGPLAELLDTRGTIQFENGNFAESAKSYQAAIMENDTPVRRFHLALALREQGETEAAAFHLRDALERGLSEQDLYPYEIERLRSLLKEFELRAAR